MTRPARLPEAWSLLLLLVLTSACHRNAGGAVAGGATSSDASPDANAEALDPRVAELWQRAQEGEADDLARLADRVGTDGLLEGAQDPARRLTALRALGYTNDLSALSFLATTASKGTDDEAAAALESASSLAAEPRRAVDPEYALELHDGCAQLLVLAKDAARPRPRRVGAVRALRMLVDRNCVKAADIPTDVDSR